MPNFNIPGVYSEIDASAAVQTLSPNTTVIGIVGTATSGDNNKPYAPLSFNDAKTKYGEASNLVKLMGVAMENGGNKFILVKADDTTTPGTVKYADALAALELEEAVKIVLIDSDNPTDFTTLKTHLTNASLNRKERISFIGFDANTDMATVTTTATTSLNSGRIFTVYPNPLDSTGAEVSGIFTAAALAGQVAAETDPSMPMTNVEIRGFYGLAKKLKDSEMSSLIDAGVIPLEINGGNISIVRAISTYTKDADSQADTTWQEITTTRISDYIMNDLRARLRRKFARSKQNKNTRDAIKSEVLSSLLEYQELEYIENVAASDVTIDINPTDATRNDVNFKYDVTSPVNVIHLTGHLVI